ncbi:DMT family transporter [Candidatus Mycoplasma mahonii]|uniref:DMT family transporter n=1 Tax=Candidatus Mycoplasma mahonii TaxID=3004105 RepID=UPI0026F0E005|nr:DMT family transporter [Candidatus Mycoplasma mahonii]WKX02292.1 DMT family transporter [Candidatus Mycoplasma mahonii]
MVLIRKLNKIEKKGVGYGFGSPILYSIDSILDILLFALVFGVGYRSNLSIFQIITYSFVTSFIKDFMLFLFMSVKTKGKILKIFFKLHKEKRRAFWWTILGSLCGGPLGFTLTTATILYSGAAYGSALANFSPIIVLLFAVAFFKTKLNLKSWIGVVLAVGGFLGLSFYSSFTNDQSFAFNIRTFIGVILAILAVLTWSVETIISEYTEKFGKDKALTDDEKLCIKSTISSSTTLIFFIPVSIAIAYLLKDGSDVTSLLRTLLSSWQAWIILIAIGSAIVIGRLSYWYAISHIGGGRADILYYLTVLFTPLLVLTLNGLHVTGFDQPNGVKQWVYWVLLLTQIFGVFLVTFNSLNNKEHIFSKKVK